MRALKIATVVMGVLIVVGTMALVIAVARRSATPSAAPTAAQVGAPAAAQLPTSFPPVVLNEPPGSHITGIAAIQDRLAVALQGGGTDRVLLIDPHTGTVTGRISLAH
jgi:hypothetical protein